jgi:hypothetical protein
MTKRQSAATIHEATRSRSEGKVIRGPQITEDQAVTRRKAGADIVICGGSHAENSDLAKDIESRVGRWIRQPPHRSAAGKHALPHYQQHSPPPEGHSFYETDNRKAAVNP